MSETPHINIIHTSDWHLGKKLYKKSFLPEQKLFLEWLKEKIISERIDILVIAGDIFDTPTPPNDAQTLYYQFLKSISNETNCQILIIGGNHDSGQFLEAPLPFLQEHNIKIWGKLSPNPENHLYRYDNDGCELAFFALPYFRTYEILKHKNLSSADDTDDLEKTIIEYVKQGIANTDKDKFFIGHHLFGHYELAGSEQALSMSGIESIGLETLSKYFTYSLLGHIHRKQTLKSDPTIEYSGAPVAFRFSETGTKQVTKITYSKLGVSKESLSIPTFRDLLRVEIREDELKDSLKKVIENSVNKPLTSYLELIIKTDKPTSGLADIAREQLTDSNVELLSFYYKVANKAEIIKKKSIDFSNLSPQEILTLFYKRKFPENEDIEEEILQDFNFFFYDNNNDEIDMGDSLQ